MSIHHHTIEHHHHKFIIGISAIVVLIIGLILGAWLATNLQETDFEAVKISLIFSSIIILLIIGSMVAEIKHILLFPKKGK